MIQVRSTGALAAGFASASLGGTNTLTSMGFYGSDVHRVAFHPTNSSILYAAAEGGFYRARGGGGGGGSVSLFMLAALSVLVRLRSLSRMDRT